MLPRIKMMAGFPSALNLSDDHNKDPEPKNL